MAVALQCWFGFFIYFCNSVWFLGPHTCLASDTESLSLSGHGKRKNREERGKNENKKKIGNTGGAKLRLEIWDFKFKTPPAHPFTPLELFAHLPKQIEPDGALGSLVAAKKAIFYQGTSLFPHGQGINQRLEIIAVHASRLHQEASVFNTVYTHLHTHTQQRSLSERARPLIWHRQNSKQAKHPSRQNLPSRQKPLAGQTPNWQGVCGRDDDVIIYWHLFSEK